MPTDFLPSLCDQSEQQEPVHLSWLFHRSHPVHVMQIIDPGSSRGSATPSPFCERKERNCSATLKAVKIALCDALLVLPRLTGAWKETGTATDIAQCIENGYRVIWKVEVCGNRYEQQHQKFKVHQASEEGCSFSLSVHSSPLTSSHNADLRTKINEAKSISGLKSGLVNDRAPSFVWVHVEIDFTPAAAPVLIIQPLARLCFHPIVHASAEAEKMSQNCHQSSTNLFMLHTLNADKLFARHLQIRPVVFSVVCLSLRNYRVFRSVLSASITHSPATRHCWTMLEAAKSPQKMSILCH